MSHCLCEVVCVFFHISTFSLPQWGADVGGTAPIVPGGAPTAGGMTTGAGLTTGAATTPGFMASDQDWSVGPTTSTKDWAADDTGDWGNTEPKVEIDTLCYL